MVEVDVDDGCEELVLVVLGAETQQAVVLLHDPAGDVGPPARPVVHRGLVLVRTGQELGAGQHQPVQC